MFFFSFIYFCNTVFQCISQRLFAIGDLEKLLDLLHWPPPPALWAHIICIPETHVQYFYIVIYSVMARAL